MQRNAETITATEIQQLLDHAIQEYDFAADQLAMAEQTMTVANRLREHCQRALDADHPEGQRAREAVASMWNHVFGQYGYTA